MSQTWAPETWRDKPAAQQPEWPDQSALDTVLDELRRVPPLVFAGEARTLQEGLARVSRGEAFLLHAGDCAESFEDFSADSIRDKLKVILQMAVVLTYASGLPVVKLGRIAGQFAKPRSSARERVGEIELPAFRGHAVNDASFDPNGRTADPRRLVRVYHQSASTLNLIRAFTKGGFADLTQIHNWNQEFVAQSTQGRRYEQIARQIDRALNFMAACGIDLNTDSALHEVDLFTSHEALLLGYEEALTRQDSITGDWYDCSAHFLWVGERTRQLDGAHVEFLSGIKNPIGCKIGPNAAPDEVVDLTRRLNPENAPGRLTLITRLGVENIESSLPELIRVVRDAGREVVWVCDPMKSFFAAHQQEGTTPGGVHLELTAEDVTECLGGAEEVLDTDLAERYRALCDPRLNARQSLDLAFEVGEMLQAF
jgi:3-deoxy-7-phosphoheptulonate synthase